MPLGAFVWLEAAQLKRFEADLCLSSATPGGFLARDGSADKVIRSGSYFSSASLGGCGARDGSFDEMIWSRSVLLLRAAGRLWGWRRFAEWGASKRICASSPRRWVAFWFEALRLARRFKADLCFSSTSLGGFGARDGTFNEVIRSGSVLLLCAAGRICLA